MTHGMNNILDKKDKLPSTWTESKTVLISKKNKTTVKDLRSMTLTNATYKLFMGILISKMENHIREIRQDSEVQAGFTRHRRIADENKNKNKFISEQKEHETAIIFYR